MFTLGRHVSENAIDLILRPAQLGESKSKQPADREKSGDAQGQFSALFEADASAESPQDAQAPKAQTQAEQLNLQLALETPTQRQSGEAVEGFDADPADRTGTFDSVLGDTDVIDGAPALENKAAPLGENNVKAAEKAIADSAQPVAGPERINRTAPAELAEDVAPQAIEKTASVREAAVEKAVANTPDGSAPLQPAANQLGKVTDEVGGPGKPTLENLAANGADPVEARPVSVEADRIEPDKLTAPEALRPTQAIDAEAADNQPAQPKGLTSVVEPSGDTVDPEVSADADLAGDQQITETGDAPAAPAASANATGGTADPQQQAQQLAQPQPLVGVAQPEARVEPDIQLSNAQGVAPAVAARATAPGQQVAMAAAANQNAVAAAGGRTVSIVDDATVKGEQASPFAASISDAPKGATATPPPAPVGPPPSVGVSIAQQVAAALRTNTAQGVIEIQLEPIELGRIELEIATREGSTHVLVSAEREESLALLRRNADVLERHLRDAGYESFDINFSDRDAQDDTGAGDRREPFLGGYSGDGASDVEPQRFLIEDRLDLRA